MDSSEFIIVRRSPTLFVIGHYKPEKIFSYSLPSPSFHPITTTPTPRATTFVQIWTQQPSCHCNIVMHRSLPLGQTTTTQLLHRANPWPCTSVRDATRSHYHCDQTPLIYTTILHPYVQRKKKKETGNESLVTFLGIKNRITVALFFFFTSESNRNMLFLYDIKWNHVFIIYFFHTCSKNNRYNRIMFMWKKKTSTLW